MPTPVHLILGQQVFRFRLTPFDSETPAVQKPASFALATTDYSKGFVARQGGNSNLFYAEPKAVGTFDVTLSGHSQDGTMISQQTLYSVTVDPVPVPQADRFATTGEETVSPDITTPGDPGNATITGTL